MEAYRVRFRAVHSNGNVLNICEATVIFNVPHRGIAGGMVAQIEKTLLDYYFPMHWHRVEIISVNWTGDAIVATGMMEGVIAELTREAEDRKANSGG
jgi:hypothetical protein